MSKIQHLLKKHPYLNRLDLEMIMADAITKTRTFVIANPEYRLSWPEYLKFKYFLCLLKHNYPIAYITHHKEFYGLDFLVNKNTLIPRPDTEILVEEAIKIIVKNTPITLIDIGTGSGCIPVAILKNLEKEIPTFAIDISEKALSIAQKNADTHNVKINFRIGDLLEPIKPVDILSTTILITANLPYLTFDQVSKEKSIQKEPRLALYGGSDGLDLYRQLIGQISNLSKTLQPKTFFLLLEIDPTQTKIIKQIIDQKISNAEIKIRQDLAGLDRLVIVKF